MALEPPPPGTEVGIPLSNATRRPEDGDESRVRGVVLKIEARAALGIGQGGLGVVPQAIDEQVQDVTLEATESLPLPDAPAMEIRRVGQVQPLERRSAEARRCLGERGRRDVRGVAGKQAHHGQRIDVRAAGVESHRLARGDEPAAPVAARDGTEPRQAPAERASRVVHVRPQQGAEPIARVLAPGEDEMREQRAGLPRSGEGDRLAAVEHAHRPEELNRQRVRRGRSHGGGP